MEMWRALNPEPDYENMIAFMKMIEKEGERIGKENDESLKR
jgi:hypothetical protein